jgi:presenilin-like A22 family membrane protease
MNEREQVYLMAGGLILYSLLVLAVALLLPTNEKLYVLYSGIAGNFSGALLMYLRMRDGSGPKHGGEA